MCSYDLETRTNHNIQQKVTLHYTLLNIYVSWVKNGLSKKKKILNTIKDYKHICYD